MKFKIKERYLVEVWTYVDADSKNEAREKLESGGDDNPDFDNPIREDHQDADWSTFQEC